LLLYVLPLLVVFLHEDAYKTSLQFLLIFFLVQNRSSKMPQEELSQDICFQIANLKFRAKELNDKEAAERLKNIVIERKALPLLQELAKELVSN